MRVCILTDNYYRGSGITLVIERLSQCAAFAEIDLFLAGCSSLKQHGPGAREAAIVPPDHYRSFALMSSGGTLLPELYRFARWLRETRCELIHVHHRRLAVLANLLRRFIQIPVLFTGHLPFSNALWFKTLAPRWATGVSPSVVTYLERCTNAKDISLIYNPLIFRNETVNPKPQSAKKVISIGRLDAVKGHETLIEAWSLLKQSGVEAQLDIFGEGPLRSSLQELIRARGLEHEVKLCGFAPDLQDRFREYAFNVLVSEIEGFPNAVVEAASRSVPTLLTNVEGSRDTLPPALALSNGLPYGDAQQLSVTLRQWLSSPELVASDGGRFHDFLKALCSPETVGAQYVNLYARMLGKKASQAIQEHSGRQV